MINCANDFGSNQISRLFWDTLFSLLVLVFLSLVSFFISFFSFVLFYIFSELVFLHFVLKFPSLF